MLICGYCKQPMTVWEWMDDHRTQRCDRAAVKAAQDLHAFETMPDNEEVRMGKVLTEENSKDSLEDRITYVLSEWLNDNAPIGQERFREPAKAVIREVLRKVEAALNVVDPASLDPDSVHGDTDAQSYGLSLALDVVIALKVTE